MRKCKITTVKYRLDMDVYSEDGNSSNYSSSVEPRRTYQTVLAAIFLILIMAFALVGNIAVIAVICLYRSLRRDISNFLIINLSITDLTNTVLVMFSALISIITDYWPFGQFWCDCICAINYCLIIVSMLTLCCISIDRYQAVINPLSYKSIVTKRRLFVVIGYSWVQGVAFGMAPSVVRWVQYDYWEAICAIQWHLFHPNSIIYVVLAFVFCFLGPGIVLVYCYVKILKEVKKQQLRVLEMPANTGDQQRARKMVSDRTRLVRSLLVVVFAYFLCTAPFSITKLIKVSMEDNNSIPGAINLVSALLGYVASAINPLIYGIFRHDFRQAYRKLLKQLCAQQWSNGDSTLFYTSDSNVKRSTAYRSEFDNVTINKTAAEDEDLDSSHIDTNQSRTTENGDIDTNHSKQTVCHAQVIAKLYDSPQINTRNIQKQECARKDKVQTNNVQCVHISVKAFTKTIHGDIENNTITCN